MFPTPTLMDSRPGNNFRTVALIWLERGFNRGINLNNLVEEIGVDWQDGDVFKMIDGKLVKNP